MSKVRTRDPIINIDSQVNEAFERMRLSMRPIPSRKALATHLIQQGLANSADDLDVMPRVSPADLQTIHITGGIGNGNL